MAELAAMIEYLQARHVHVAAVLLPIITWNDAQPFAAAFSRRAEQLCRDLRVPLLNLAHVVPDDEFFHGTHLAYQGQRRSDAAIRKFIQSLGS